MEPFKKMKIFLTGSSGFLGQRVLKKLLSQNHFVLGVDQKKNFIKHKNFKFVNLNLKKSKKIKIKENFDVAIHTAAVQPYRKDENFKKYLNGNLISGKNFFDLAINLGIKKFIICSSFSVYGKSKKNINENENLKPRNFYGLSKKFLEDLTQYYHDNYNLNTIILRFDGIFGYEQNLPGFIQMVIKKAIKNEKIQLYNNGKLKRDYIYVDDATDAIILALKKINKYKFEIFNIGSGFPKTSHKIAKIVLKYFKSKSKLEIIKNKNKNINQDIFMNISKAKKKLALKPNNLISNLKKIKF